MCSARTAAFALSCAALMVASRAAIADSAITSAPSEIQAGAGDPVAPVQGPATPEHDDVAVPPSPPSRGSHAASSGAFLPFTIGAATDGTYGKALSGYDGSRRALVYEGAADASVV